jgi:site-specific DNA-cytosine methylase
MTLFPSLPGVSFHSANSAPGSELAGGGFSKLRILVNCEYSGAVRRAFRALGHDAWSCDLLPSEDNSPHHIIGDAIAAARSGPWDAMICFPPCTDLCVSGARHFPAKIADGRQGRALQFVRDLLACDIPCISLENPIGVISSHIRKPDQIIQPWQFGHGETKATCLWLKGLPKLVPTDIVDGREARVHRMPPGPNRWKEQSRTFDGIAQAMAAQWGHAILASRQSRISPRKGADSTEGAAGAAIAPPINSAWGRIGDAMRAATNR